MVIPTIRYQDAPAAIDFLCDAFGFARNAVYTREGDASIVEHAQLTYGDGMLMLGSVRDDGAESHGASGSSSVYVVVEDADAHVAQARAAGAEIVREPVDQDYGGRDYTARDPEGNVWSFGTYKPDAAAS